MKSGCVSVGMAKAADQVAKASSGKELQAAATRYGVTAIGPCSCVRWQMCALAAVCAHHISVRNLAGWSQNSYT